MLKMADSPDKVAAAGDTDALSEGELEDGEVVSSDDEEQEGGTGSETQPIALPAQQDDTDAGPAQVNSTKRAVPDDSVAGGPEKKPRLDSPPPNLEEGEIYSDDEEAAYFPQRVKPRTQTDTEMSSTEPSLTASQWKTQDRDGDGRESSPEDYDDHGHSSSYYRHRPIEKSKSPQGKNDSYNEGTESKRSGHLSSRISRYSSPSRSGRRERGDQSDGEGEKGGYHHQKRRGGYQSHYHAKGQRSSFKAGYHQRYWDPSGRGLTGQAFNKLIREIKSRREKGLSLLSIPPGTKPCNNLDEFNYPAPPSWYDEAVKEWEQKQEEVRNTAMATGVTDSHSQDVEMPVEQGGETGWTTVGTFVPTSKPIPLFGPTSVVQVVDASRAQPPQLAEQVASPVSDFETPDIAATTEDSLTNENDLSLTEKEQDDKPEVHGKTESVQQMETEMSQAAGVPIPGDLIQSSAPVKSSSNPEPVTPVLETVPARPNIEDDFDYDKYLDQLDEEEDEEEGESAEEGGKEEGEDSVDETLPPIDLTSNPLDEDFPVIASRPQEVTKASEDVGSESLKDLFAGEMARTWNEKNDPKQRTGTNTKSARRKQKDAAWRSKLKVREQCRQDQPVKPKQPCKYYRNGFCRHGDNCQYAHDGPREKKKEVCKFYLQDSCMKGNECLYYHEAFPCKFFHTNTFCKNGDNCKFSHAPLKGEDVELLQSVLEPTRGPIRQYPTEVVPYLTTPGIGPSGTHTRPPNTTQFYSPFKDSDIPTLAHQSPAVSAPVVSQSAETPDDDRGTTELVVSIPTILTGHTFLVSIPFSKLNGRYNSRLAPQAMSEDSTSKLVLTHLPISQPPTTSGSLPPSFTPPLANALNQPCPPPTLNQGGPIPLFPPKPTAVPPPFTSPSQPKRALLPTPPPHLKLNPQDLEKMEVNVPEYWEDPKLVGGSQPVALGPPPPQFPGPAPYCPGPAPYCPPPPMAVPCSLPNMANPRPELRPSAMSQRQAPFGPPLKPVVGNPVFPGTAAPLPPSRQVHMELGPLAAGVDPRQARMDPRHYQQAQSPPRTNMNHVPPHPSLPPPSNPHPPVNTFHPTVEPSIVAPLATSLPQRPGVFSGPAVPPFGRPPSQSPGISTTWGACSPEQQSRGPEGVKPETAVTLSPEPRRVDPRMKYAHLRIKPKTQATASPSILKKSTGPVGSTSDTLTLRNREQTVKIPELLRDPSNLDKPLDPQELFGSEEIGGVGSSEYGDLSGASFGTYKSFFSKASLKGESSNKSNAGTEFGEITLHESQRAIEKDESGGEHKTDTGSAVNTAAGTEAKPVPSYFAGLGLGTDSDLQIDSAFGSLESQHSEDGSGGTVLTPSSQQHDTAKALPNIYGFGS